MVSAIRNFLSEFISLKIQYASAIEKIGHLRKKNEYDRVSKGSILFIVLMVIQYIEKNSAKINHFCLIHSHPNFLKE